MTLFEYLAIAFSLILSFAAMRLIGGLPHALARTRRYWVHLGVLGLLLFAITMTFWVFWSYRDVAWSFQKFLLALASPAILYFLSATLVPENPGGVTSWREYYYSVRVRLFVGVCCLAPVVAVAATVLIDLPWDHPSRLAGASILIIGVVGASTANPRVHSGILASSLLLAGIVAATIFSRASPLIE